MEQLRSSALALDVNECEIRQKGVWIRVTATRPSWVELIVRDREKGESGAQRVETRGEMVGVQRRRTDTIAIELL